MGSSPSGASHGGTSPSAVPAHSLGTLLRSTALPPRQHIPAPSQPQPGASAGVRGSKPLGTQERSPRTAPKRSPLPAASSVPTATRRRAHLHLREGFSTALSSSSVLFPGSTTGGNTTQNTCTLYWGKHAILCLCYQAEIKEGAYICRQSVHLERAALLMHSQTPPYGTENG